MPRLPIEPIPPSDMDPRAPEPMPAQVPAQHDEQDLQDTEAEPDPHHRPL
jgi:hypothetical protein